MKKILILTVTIFILTIATAMAGGCWYEANYGDHDWEQVEVRMPTCDKDGYYLLECRICGKNKKVTTGKAYGHDWKKTGSKDATCTKDGYVSYECQNCYKTKKETVSKYGHNWKYGSVIEEATCTSEGKVNVTCKRCGKKSTQSTSKLAHTFGNWQDEIPATDHSTGIRKRFCEVCSFEDSETYYPEGTLLRGSDEKDAVKELQQQLIDLGYLKDKADGIFGKKTEKAVVDYQTKMEFETTGIAFPQTLSSVRKDWNIFKGIDVEPEYPDFCGNDAYCEKHQSILTQTESIIKAANTDEDLVAAWKTVRAIWTSQMEGLYAEIAAGSAPEDVPVIVSAKTSFCSI